MMIPKHIKDQAKQYKTIEQINEKIYTCVQGKSLEFDELLLWSLLYGERDKLEGRKPLVIDCSHIL
jgi:hypothetical protein